MPKKYAGIFATVILILSVAAGSWFGRRIDHIREAEAFYRWLTAAATNERLFSEKVEGEEQDRELLLRTAEAAASMLPDGTKDASAALQTITDWVADPANNYRLWEVVESNRLADVRAEFLRLYKAGKLSFTKDISYAQAQASGVGVFNLFFGFRKLAANFVWLQVDRYWHQGMMHRMIPLMRTTVLLDPNFIDAYLLGAWHLAYNATAHMPDTPVPLQQWHPRYKRCLGPKETYYYIAIDFLKDGIRNNPRNYKLYFDLGFGIYSEKLKDYPNAVKYLSEAVRQPHDRWVPRQLYRALERNGEYEKAIAGWKDYLKKFPDNETAPRFILRNEALMHEKQGDEMIEKAEQTQDPTEKERLLQQADVSYQKALEVLDKMNEPFAEVRKLRIQAVRLANTGRYPEAVAVLDKARWQSGEYFDELSDLIIAYKQKGNIPLSLSEEKAVLRRAEGTRCPGMPDEGTAPHAAAVSSTSSAG